MRPAHYRIMADSHDITAKIADRFLGLTITDAAGKDSDTLTLTLDNRDDKLAFPATGAKLRVWIGLEGSLVDKGLYSVTEISEGLDSGEVEISGTAADMGGPIKGQKTRTWEAPLTLGKLASTIAGENGLACNVHPSCEGLELGHLNQKAESDMNLLTRICKVHGLLMKAGAGRVLIVPMEAGENAEGQPIPMTVIDDPTESSGRVTIQERGSCSSVTATWFDEGRQCLVNEVVSTGAEGASVTLKGKHKTQAEAQAAAKARIEAAARGRATMELVRPLTPEIVSPGKVKVTGHRQSANGVWFCSNVTHTIGSSGVSSTSLSLTTEEHDASKK